MKENNFKAGLFVLVTLALLFWMILKVGQGGLFSSGKSTLYMDVDSAVGVGKNTPVQIAGVDIGVVENISLTPERKARLKIFISDDIKLLSTSKGIIKQTGILGDSFVEIIPGLDGEELKSGAIITDVSKQGDLSSVTGQFSVIGEDVQAITSQMRKLMAGDDSSFAKTMENIEKITTSLQKVTSKNEDNIDVIIANMKVISENLNYVIANNMSNVNGTLYNVNDITGTIQRGEGTIGRLVKDEETVEKLNNTLDSFNEFLGGAGRLKVDMNAHSEYLGGTGQYKNYVGISLHPRPDKYFSFEVTSDPDPSFSTSETTTEITSGGTTNTINVTERSKDLGRFQFSAQLAKKFKDLTLRGGLIESSGGLGLDYNYGPVGVQFSAFDFKTEFGQKPHLKAMGTAQLTRTFYLLGGLDDFINPSQDLDWFFGGGIKFTDDDIKSLLGVFSAAVR